MMGYLNQTGTPVLPPGRYYRTGDHARRDEHGCLYFAGRLDDLFKSHDVRVSPLEIERVLKRHPLVDEVAVFAIRDEVGELVPAAACVASDVPHRQSLPARLLAWQRDQLPASHHVVQVWVVEQLPKTASGKISRASLRDRFRRNTSAA